VVSGNFIGRFWLILHVIKTEGLWRTAQRGDQPYISFTDYAHDFCAEQVKEVSRRTIFGMMGKIEALGELGVEISVISNLISGMLSTTERALALGEFDPASGEFLGLPAGVREPGETRRHLLWVSHVNKTDASRCPAGSGSRTLCLRRICH
jgi:hypothetical protein